MAWYEVLKQVAGGGGDYKVVYGIIPEEASGQSVYTFLNIEHTDLVVLAVKDTQYGVSFLENITDTLAWVVGFNIKSNSNPSASASKPNSWAVVNIDSSQVGKPYWAIIRNHQTEE